jgi:CO dehydrogenase nickel-insertion accessory protein CooC1
LLGELEGASRVVVCDLEAGLGTVLRMQAEQVDVVLAVAEPTAKSIEVARRAAESASGRAGRVIVVANRIASDADLEAVQAVLGEHEIVTVPEEPAIARADRDGVAPIDVDESAPGVRALTELADRLLAVAA